jgi:hypothetical protein
MKQLKFMTFVERNNIFYIYKRYTIYTLFKFLPAVILCEKVKKSEVTRVCTFSEKKIPPEKDFNGRGLSTSNMMCEIPVLLCVL